MQATWFSNLPTKRKIVIGVSAPLLLMCIVGAIGLFALWKIQTTTKWVDHTHSVLNDAGSIVAGAVDMETGMRGFLLAGREAFLEPYAAGEASTYDRIVALQETVNDNPAQVERLGEVEAVLRNWQADVTEPMIALRREIGDAPTMNDIARLVGEERGKVYFDKFRGQIKEFTWREQALLTRRRAEFVSLFQRGSATSAATQEALDWVIHTYEVIGKANALLTAAIDMETGMRGYLLAGQPQFLEPFESGQVRFDALIEDLTTTVSDNPTQVALLGEIDGTIQEWISEVVEPAIALRTSIGDSKTMDDMADLVGEARGKTYIDQFRGLMADSTVEENALMVTRQASSVNTMRVATAGILGTMILAVIAGFVVATRIGSSISGPIVGITGALAALVEGRSDITINGQERADEVGDIARAAQVFKENAEKAQELAQADAEKSKELKRAADEQVKLAEDRERDQRASNERAATRQAMMTRLQASMTGVVSGAAEGEFSGRVETDFEDKDLAELARDVNRLMTVVSDSLGATVGVLAKFADGDLSVRMEGQFAGAHRELQSNLNGTIERLSELLGDISAVAANVTSDAQEIDGGAAALSNRTAEQAAAIEETAAAMEEISATIKSNAQNSRDARELAADACHKARDGGAIVNNAISAISEIEASSKKVADIVSLIDNIAYQTNLLALNASVEAARAGEAGKGFAVVAAEVRGLAQRASDASNDIRGLIEESGKAIGQGVQLVSETGSSLEAILSSVERVEERVSEIAKASEEQSSGVAEISATVTTFDQLTQQNASMAMQSAENAASLSQGAGQLNRLLAFFTRTAEILDHDDARAKTA